MEYHTITERYFQNLDLPESVQTHLMGRLDLQLQTLSDKVRTALQISKEAMEACVKRQGTVEAQAMEWKKCEGTCKSLITDAVNQEIGSTAFMLKLLADSVIRPDGKKHRLKFGLDESFYKGAAEGSGNKGKSAASCRVLTGRWKDDSPFLHLVLPPSKQGRLAEGSRPKGRLSEGPRPSGRLIMGFGPSASGKTHWAKTILRLLQQADDQFPEVFFAVDGGLVRESSAVYQFATEMAHCAGFAGFTNLHAGMFVTGDIKHAMEKYLLQESQRSTISLYVPETLGKCEFMVGGVTIPLIRSCEDYLKTFMNITRDPAWIGLLIWQHATAADHGKDAAFSLPSPYSDPKYACIGCEASGREREKGEGKPYEGHVYAQSMKNGRKYMELAPGGRYEIHNAGRQDGMSVLWDRSVLGVGNRFSEIMQEYAQEKGIQYVDARGVSQAARETGAVLGEFMQARRATNNVRAATNAAEGTEGAAAKRLAALRAETAATSAAKTAAKTAAKITNRRAAAEMARADPSFITKLAAATAAKEKAAAMNAKIATGLNRLSAAAVPVKSNANHYRNIAHSLTRKANAKRSAIPVENMAIEVRPNAKRNADRLLAEGQAKLPAPSKSSIVLGNEVVPGFFTNSVQPVSQYHNRSGMNTLNALS